MSKRLDVTVSDAMYDAVIDYAASKGFANDRDRGKRPIVVQALHYWLNKMGAPASVLRMSDAEYANHKRDVSGYAEGAQNGNGEECET